MSSHKADLFLRKLGEYSFIFLTNKIMNYLG